MGGPNPPPRPFSHPMKLTLLLQSLTLGCLLQAGAAVPTGYDAAGQLQPVNGMAKAPFAFARLESGIQFRVNDTVKNLLFYGPDIVRVNANLGKTHTTQPSLTVIQRPAPASPQLSNAVESSGDDTRPAAASA